MVVFHFSHTVMLGTYGAAVMHLKSTGRRRCFLLLWGYNDLFKIPFTAAERVFLIMA